MAPAPFAPLVCAEAMEFLKNLFAGVWLVLNLTRLREGPE